MTDAPQATPINELADRALALMKDGGAFRIMPVNDPSFSSHTFSGEVAQAIATREITLADATALPEVRALVEAAVPYVSPVQNADWGRQMRQYEALVLALAPFKELMK